MVGENEMKAISGKAAELDVFCMVYEVAAQVFFGGGYLEGFYDFYEIKSRELRLITSPFSFEDTLKEVCSDDVWRHIYEKTVSLFGRPDRVAVFEDDGQRSGRLISELEGPDGLAPFFFVFDIMFCEYDGFALCFISGSNN